MTFTKEPYAYFQPGEIFYFISHERDELINPEAELPAGARLISTEISGTERDQPGRAETSEPESYQSLPDKADDSEQSDHDQDEIKYDQKIDELINWSNEIAEKSLKHTLIITRVKEREMHFRGTKKANEPSAPEISDPEWKKWDAMKSPTWDVEKSPRKPQPRGAFSLIPAQVLISKDDKIWKKEEYETNPHRYVERSELAELVVALDNVRTAQPFQSDFTLRAVSPNWLSSPSSEYGGGGGPGGIPEPYRRIKWTEWIKWIKWILNKLLPNFPEPAFAPPPYHPILPASKAGLQARLGNEGKGVTVAILDTAPSQQDMAAAYERHCKVNPKNQKKYEHDTLIEELLGPDSPLEVHYASMDDLLRMRAVHLKDHDYEMPDHGLFVAGIIHSLAGQAKIHLYEVLNSQGVGDLLSIAKGFGQILDRFSGQPLVVNCSLVLNIPRLDHRISNLDKAFLAKIIKDWEKHKNEQIEWLTKDLLGPKGSDGREWLRRQGEAIEWLCDQLYFYNSRVVAAAGNGWKRDEGKERPVTSYPAEFKSVLGVGALPKDAQPDATTRKYPAASYSNIADEPPEQGVTTLGGEPGEGKGVLGIYIGKFPDMHYRLQQYPWYLRPIMWAIFAIKWCSIVGPKNETDLAWWCGTSFATPMIAGLTAAVLSDLPKGASTQAAIVTMYSTTGIRQGLTNKQEDGVEGITQA
jgi:subtilase family protein